MVYPEGSVAAEEMSEPCPFLVAVLFNGRTLKIAVNVNVFSYLEID